MKRPVGITAILSLALAISFIAACGGGGGGGDLSSDLQGTWELVSLGFITYADNTCSGGDPDIYDTNADEFNYGDWVVGETETSMYVVVDESLYIAEFGLYTLEGNLDDFTFTVTGAEPVGVAGPPVEANSYLGSYDGTADPPVVVLTDQICRADADSGVIMLYSWERVSDSTEMPR